MTRRGHVLAIGCLLAALPMFAAPARADDGPSVTPGVGNIVVNVTDHVSGSGLGAASATGQDNGAPAPPPPCDQISLPNAPCEPVTRCISWPASPTGFLALSYQGIMFADGLNYFDAGPCSPSAASAGTNLPDLVLRAFQRIPLPAPTLDIQPPKGKTLIGLETIYSTKAEPFTRNLTLLGQPIQLRIHATSYTWNHGDNTTQTTDWPGKPWQRGTSIDSYITHTYQDTGNVTPTVRVTWSAEYRVSNGTWQPVNGTVERTSPPTALQIVEAEPQLVAP